VQFEWDSRKAAANLRKHGVTFVDATEVFIDLSLGFSLTRTIRSRRSAS